MIHPNLDEHKKQNLSWHLSLERAHETRSSAARYRLFFDKENKKIDKKINNSKKLTSELLKNKKLMDFISVLVSKSNIDNIKDIDILSNSDRTVKISYVPIKTISKEELLLNKLSNKEYEPSIIETYIFFNDSSISIMYDLDPYSTKYIHHEIRRRKILNKYNNTDITDNYLNNIFLVTENIKNNILKTKIDKNSVIDFINLNLYGNTYKKDNIDFINTLPNILGPLDISEIAKHSYYTDEPIHDFIKIFFNKIFAKSVFKSLLDYDSKNMIRDGIINIKKTKELKIFNQQCKILADGGLI